MPLPSISSSSLVASSTEERGYQSINTDHLDHVNVDIEESPLASGESSTKGTGWSKGARRIVLGALLGIIVVLVGGKSVFPPRAGKQKGIRVRIGNITSVDKNPSISSNRVVDNDDVGNDEHDPFQLSPVLHMGMLSTHRNDDASPSDVWGKFLNKEKTPLPTNSWYLVRSNSSHCIVLLFCVVFLPCNIGRDALFPIQTNILSQISHLIGWIHIMKRNMFCAESSISSSSE